MYRLELNAHFTENEGSLLLGGGGGSRSWLRAYWYFGLHLVSLITVIDAKQFNTFYNGIVKQN